jgi:hypothetical protein
MKPSGLSSSLIRLFFIAGLCTLSLPVSAAGAQGSNRCDASKVHDLIGKRGDSIDLEKARTRANAVQVRRFTRGLAYTMESIRDRLSIFEDEAGFVIATYCG